MSVLGTFENFLMFYNDVRLVWTVKLPMSPIFIDRMKVDETDGLIVTLSDRGHLQVSYLGTN